MPEIILCGLSDEDYKPGLPQEISCELANIEQLHISTEDAIVIPLVTQPMEKVFALVRLYKKPPGKPERSEETLAAVQESVHRVLCRYVSSPRVVHVGLDLQDPAQYRFRTFPWPGSQAER